MQAFSPVLLKAALEGHNYDGLTSMPKPAADVTEYVSIDLEMCGTECDQSLLTAWQVGGAGGTGRRLVARRVIIPAAVAADLLAHGRGEMPSTELPSSGYGGIYHNG